MNKNDYKIVEALAGSLLAEENNKPYKTYTGKVLQGEALKIFNEQSIQAFFTPDETNRRTAQFFTGSGTISDPTTGTVGLVSEQPDTDDGWRQAFRTVPLGSNDYEFEIYTISGGGTAAEIVPEGDEVKFATHESSTLKVTLQKLGKGFNLSRRITDGNRAWALYNALEDGRNAIRLGLANLHYGILNTAGNNNATTTYATGTGTALQRVIATLNTAQAKIASDLKDEYSNAANAPLLFYTTPAYDSVVFQAINMTRSEAAVGQTANFVRRNIIPIVTTNSNIRSNGGVLVLPGNSIQNAIKSEYLSFSQQDIKTLGTTRTVWAEAGAGVGNNKQVLNVNLA